MKLLDKKHDWLLKVFNTKPNI